MNYSKSVKFLNSFVNYERWITYNPRREFNLDRMKLFCARLGDPQKKFHSVLVAGTKGKGSTVAMLESILRASGYKTGRYTSPHLIDLRERIEIFGKPISKTDFAVGMTEIRKKIGNLQPTYFEILTLLAFLTFAKKKVKIAVVEVGLGGRLDATNVLDPLISVITSISYDHMKELGSTLTKIAREKSGIIKYGGVVISAPQEKEAQKVIFDTAEKRKAILLETPSPGASRPTLSRFAGEGTLAHEFPRPRRGRGVGVRVSDFQKENETVASTVAEALLNFGFDRISYRSIQKGLKTVRWPGRFEIASRKPIVILDGAHNGESMQAILSGVRKKFPKSRIIPVVGISQGKDWKRMSEALEKVSSDWIATEYQAERACPAQELNGKFIAAPVSKAIQLAKTMASPNDVILVTGSLFLVGEAKQYVQN